MGNSWNRYQKSMRRKVKPVYIVTRQRSTAEDQPVFVLLADDTWGHFKLLHRDPTFDYSGVPHADRKIDEIAKVYKTRAAALKRAEAEAARLGVPMVIHERYPS